MKSKMTLALAASMLTLALAASPQDAQAVRRSHPKVVDANSGGPSLTKTVVVLAESVLTLLVP
jgi:hypothetical protein